MKELLVISGKGGTGKTSITAAFAALAGDAVLVDCDVDAADLHLILDPADSRPRVFVGGKVAAIDRAACTACGRCADACRFEAVTVDEASDGPCIHAGAGVSDSRPESGPAIARPTAKHSDRLDFRRIQILENHEVFEIPERHRACSRRIKPAQEDGPLSPFHVESVFG